MIELLFIVAMLIFGVCSLIYIVTAIRRSDAAKRDEPTDADRE